MAPKSDYLKKKKDIERVFKKGKKFKEDFLIVKIAQNNLNQTRFGFIVSRKISKKATVRNKIKRRLKETIREKAKLEKGLEKGKDVLIIACPGLETKDFWEIKEAVYKLLERAKCLPR